MAPCGPVTVRSSTAPTSTGSPAPIDANTICPARTCSIGRSHRRGASTVASWSSISLAAGWSGIRLPRFPRGRSRCRPEVGDHLLTPLPDRLHARRLRDRAHLDDAHDLGGPYLFELLDLRVRTGGGS